MFRERDGRRPLFPCREQTLRFRHTQRISPSRGVPTHGCHRFPRPCSPIFAARSKITLIDVRTPAEFGEVHVDFAHDVPLDRLEVKDVRAVGGDGPVYLRLQVGRPEPEGLREDAGRGLRRCGQCRGRHGGV